MVRSGPPQKLGSTWGAPLVSAADLLWALGPNPPSLRVGPALFTNLLPTAFLGGFDFCTPSWHRLLRSPMYTGPPWPGCSPRSCCLSEVKLISPLDPSGCGRKSRQLRGAGTQVQSAVWKVREVASVSFPHEGVHFI